MLQTPHERTRHDTIALPCHVHFKGGAELYRFDWKLTQLRGNGRAETGVMARTCHTHVHSMEPVARLRCRKTCADLFSLVWTQGKSHKTPR